MKNLIDKLEKECKLSFEEWQALLNECFYECRNGLAMPLDGNSLLAYASNKARKIRKEVFGNKIYIRGLIEFTNFCKNDCYYCGLRKSNKEVKRYRLDKETILECCKKGYELGFRTFVLQGGEDLYFNDEIMESIIKDINKNFSDCAITLSIGEKSAKSYDLLKKAGANRYLLRHETADKSHYEKLHPEDMSFENRIECLLNLKKLKYQTGCGIMVGSPYQTIETIAKDFMFMEKLQPEMVGIGPFLPQHATPFCNEKGGTLEETLFVLSLTRIMLKKALLPATTALGTVYEGGRELGILCGANVVMPNLSPLGVRKNYQLYDNKICMGDEAAESVNSLRQTMAKIGYEIVTERGDSPYFKI